MSVSVSVKVPFFSGKKSFEKQWGDISGLLDEVIQEGKFVNGSMVKELEKDVERYTGARHGIAVNNATDALHILLKAAGVGPGDEVIVPCFTFFASASSIANVGATPVFVDIGPGNYNLDANRLEEKITSRTKAIMPVHLFTQMADMEKVNEVALRYGLTVLEDSAEGIGMWAKGIHAGLHGKAGVLSFFPTKTWGAIGDAGMILTHDDEFAESCRMLRCHGQKEGQPYIHHRVGYNSRMDDIQAAVLRVKLDHLAQDLARREHLAHLYDQYLKGLPAVRTPRMVEYPYASNRVYYVYLIEAENRDGLVGYLDSQGIGTEIYYPRPLHLQPCFESLGYRPGDFPRAERASECTVGLPFYPDLTEEQVVAVCGAIHDFYGKAGG